jgi:hypothetical protein
VPKPRQKGLFWLLIAGALAIAIAACWVIPVRLLSASWYTFGYLGDEYLYAQRIQPLFPGISATNSLNGVGDPNVVSPFWLEDSLRGIITLLHVDVINFVWAWRFLFPLAHAASFLFLARSCLPRRARPWNASLQCAAGLAAFTLLYCLYDLVISFPPCHGFIERFPTNIEYPLSVLLAAQYIRFLSNPTARSGILLALASAAAAYFRLYLAFPWSITIIIGVIYLLATKQLSVRVAAITAGVLALVMSPWLFVVFANRKSQDFAELNLRYFGPPAKYTVHPRWYLYIAFGVIFLIAAKFVEKRHRVLALGAGVTMLLLPFLCSLTPFASEILGYDRFGCYYLVAFLAIALLSFGNRTLSWCGTRGRAQAHRMLGFCALASVVCAVVIGAMNYSYKFDAFPQRTFPSVQEDLAFVPAYRWIRENTPEGSLCLVDDGFDWSIGPKFNAGGMPVISGYAPDGSYMLAGDDLFQIVARRPRVYTHRLMGFVLSTNDVSTLGYLHRGTFGLPVPGEVYSKALMRFKPAYILWRKNKAPIPRGYGGPLKAQSETVYSDSVCEIWKLKY